MSNLITLDDIKNKKVIIYYKKNRTEKYIVIDINDKKHVWDFSQRGRLAIKYRLIYNL